MQTNNNRPNQQGQGYQPRRDNQQSNDKQRDNRQGSKNTPTGRETTEEDSQVTSGQQPRQASRQGGYSSKPEQQQVNKENEEMQNERTRTNKEDGKGSQQKRPHQQRGTL